MTQWLVRRGLLATLPVASVVLAFSACSSETGAPQSGESADTSTSIPPASGQELAESVRASDRIARLTAQFYRFPKTPQAQPQQLPPGAPTPKPLPAIEPTPVLSKGEASRFLQAAGRVRAEVDPSLKRETHRPATVELPTRADGFVRIQADGSNAGVEFALRGARRNAELEVSEGIAYYAGGAPEGGDVAMRVTKTGVEDYVVLSTKPSSPYVDYAVDVSEIAGLRLYENTLEFLNRDGALHVRVDPPMLYDTVGVRHWAKLSLIGCQADTSSDVPDGRPVTPPRASECTLRVSWDDSKVVYPALLDPVWSSGADMATARYQVPAVRMGNGRTLVCGGLDSDGDPLTTCEIFNPAGGTAGEGIWNATGAMNVARYNHELIWLGTAQNVLAVGGDSTPTSERYNGTSWTNSINDFSSISCPTCGGVINASITSDNAYVVLIDYQGQPFIWVAATNTWAKGKDEWNNPISSGTRHPSPVASYRYGAKTIGIPGQNTIMRAGGYWYPASTAVYLKSVERYRPSIDPFVTAAPGCTPSAPLPSPQCATGKVCQAGACVALDATCNGGAGCPSHQYCKAGTCKDIDRSCSPACGPGTTCDGGFCEPLGTVGVAPGDDCAAACPAGQYCSENSDQCRELAPACIGGCSAGYTCYYGSCYQVGSGCAPACGAGEFCTTWNACYKLPLGCDPQCTAGQVCDGDTCVGSNPWTTPGDAASMDAAHSGAAIMALDTNRVMVYGGSNAIGQSSKAEIYSGSANTWTYTSGDLPNNGSASQNGHGATFALHGGTSKFMLAPDGGIFIYDPVAAATPFLRIDTNAYNFYYQGSTGNVTTAGSKVLMVPVQPQGSNSPAQKACKLFDFGDKGSFCTNTGECKAGLTCVYDTWGNDNKSVCCDTACTEACMSCRAANKTSGTDEGTCGPRKTNMYVGDTNCPYTQPSTCGTTGYYCDGAGACAKYANTQRCGNQSCADSDTQNNERFCDGNGTCAAQTTTECGDGYLCTGSQCYNYCYNDVDYCESNYFCNTTSSWPGVCEAKKSDGAACNYNNAECINGNCVDGVCCDTACNGTCEACTNALTGQSTGTCNPITAGTDPNFDCDDFGAGNCGQNGLCNGAGECQLYASGTTCVAANCATPTSRNNTDSCNGTGTCVDGGVTNCAAGYACVSGVCQTTCSTDSHCASSYYCDPSGQCVADKALGQSCARDAVCSGNSNCVDGVCCDSSCAGSCRSCLGARTGLTDGTCSNTLDDTDPENECTMEVGYPGSCQAPGLCNGAGACRTYAKLGVECDVDDCAGSTLKSYECNGTGLCKEKSISCYPFLCDAGGTACRVDCSDDAHCVTGSSCENGTCVGQLELGQACTRGAQCKSTYCANVGEGWLDGQDPILDPVTNEPIVNHEDYPGVCCDEDCRGLCRGCKKSIKGGGSDGICDPVADHSDPKDDCPLDTTNSCGQNGNCNGAGGCRRTPNGTSCGETSCQGNSVLGQTCQEGQCQANPSGTDCEPYVCRDVNGAFQCTNPCADDNDCQDGYYCSEMACKKKLANGQACETSAICNSGYCVDGVCCDASCNGQCEACAEPGSEGVCIAVEGQPRGNRTECDFAGEECGGACDGVNAAACDYAPTGTECGESSCTNSVADASECDGSGSCRPKDPERCLPFACGDDDKCLITCAIDEDCSSGFRCDVAAQSCVPANVSAECSDDSLDSVGQNGIKTPCKPFLCVPSSGTCAVSCAFTQDCAPGFVCEASTKTCLPAPEGGAAEEEGCACRAAGAPTRSSHHYLALVALGLAVAGLRRRRRPQLSE